MTKFMDLAIEEAIAAGARNEVPVGAVIARKGKIIAAQGNRIIGNADPTAHAEILAIRQACATVQSERLVDCDLYVSLEPCPMCAAAIGFARIRRLYYGAEDIKAGGVDHGVRLFSQPGCNHRPEVYGGIQQETCANLLRDFFEQRR